MLEEKNIIYEFLKTLWSLREINIIIQLFQEYKEKESQDEKENIIMADELYAAATGEEEPYTQQSYRYEKPFMENPKFINFRENDDKEEKRKMKKRSLSLIKNIDGKVIKHKFRSLRP